MKRTERRMPGFRPWAEVIEDRVLLSGPHRTYGPAPFPTQILLQPGFYHPERPNTPVLPYGVLGSLATYIDPTVQINQANRIAVGTRSFLAPYARLDARGGFIKIAGGSAIYDNARLI